jgi:phosphatidylserine decarboxylase
MTDADDAKYQAIYKNYVALYSINMTQFAPSDWTAYPSVNAFFIRALQPGARPLASVGDDSVVVSPADARVYVFPVVPMVRATVALP